MIVEEINILYKFSIFIKYKRKKLGLTQQEVADRVGSMDRVQYSKIERNKVSGLHIDTMARILSALESNISFTENETI